ncbi:MAG: M14 family zinc carboxypeptidase [Candidatus Eisenbacteria bacterium]
MTSSQHRLAVLLVCFVLISTAAQAYTGDHPKMKVRLDWPSGPQWQTLESVPDLDLMKIVPGTELILVSDAKQVERLEALGFHVEVLVEDLEEHYAAQREGYRNFGELYTYSEAVAFLDQFHALYPEITTEKFSIGTTYLGNTIWALKVSDNPEVDEDEPEVLFDAMHHAREPITANVLIETIRHLCENYGTDAEATFLVDNRETFFVPVLNVDGYLYNESTYPEGGGLWRKNRRDNAGSSCKGVDLNRNYPYEWGGVGSSSDPCSDTYRGTSGGSEPCVQALMNFCQSRNIITHDSYHSVAGLILLPWSYTNAHTPDDALLRQIAYAMQAYCGYTVGQPGEVLYNCSGTTTDWAYGELGIFSFCTEVDGSDFWPQDSEVPGLVAENIPKNLYLMKAAGCYLSVEAAALSGGDGDGQPDPGETLDLVVTIHNDGVISGATNAAISLSTDDSYVQMNEVDSDLGTVGAGDDIDNAADPFSFTIDPAAPAGHVFHFTCSIVADGFAASHPLSWSGGDLPLLFADDMESGAGGWTHGVVTPGDVDQWHLSALRNHTAGGGTSWKFGDTGAGDYANNGDGALVTPLMPAAGAVELSFWHWIEAEVSSYFTGQAYDGGIVEVSRDGGPWTQVTPTPGYTHTARGSGPFAFGTPLFSGVIDWRQETVLVEDVEGSLQVRFHFGTDGGTVREGWYVDDVEIRGSTNGAPGTPSLVGPLDGETVLTAFPTLIVANAADPDPGDVLTYGYRVYGDPLLTDLQASITGVGEGLGTTAWTLTSPLDDGTYYWRAFADDGAERGPAMAAASFIVSGAQGIAERTWANGIRLLGAAPSPGPGWTCLQFEVGRAGWIESEIFDAGGRRVRTLRGLVAAGSQTLLWDGRDGAGRPVSGGLYLYRVRAGLDQQTGRILLIP